MTESRILVINKWTAQADPVDLEDEDIDVLEAVEYITGEDFREVVASALSEYAGRVVESRVHNPADPVNVAIKERRAERAEKQHDPPLKSDPENSRLEGETLKSDQPKEET